ncbi:hypothetical protein T11_14027, partial [Trichinella zimbabwensis]
LVLFSQRTFKEDTEWPIPLKQEQSGLIPTTCTQLRFPLVATSTVELAEKMG